MENTAYCKQVGGSQVQRDGCKRGCDNYSNNTKMMSNKKRKAVTACLTSSENADPLPTSSENTHRSITLRRTTKNAPPSVPSTERSPRILLLPSSTENNTEHDELLQTSDSAPQAASPPTRRCTPLRTSTSRNTHRSATPRILVLPSLPGATVNNTEHDELLHTSDSAPQAASPPTRRCTPLRTSTSRNTHRSATPRILVLPSLPGATVNNTEHDELLHTSDSTPQADSSLSESAENIQYGIKNANPLLVATSKPKKPSNRPLKLRNYKIEDLEAAMNAVVRGNVSVLKASSQYSVPRSTLQDKLHGRTQLGCAFGPDPVLPAIVEERLVNFLIDMGRRGFPLRICDLRKLVQDIVTESKLPNPFPNGKPGKSWLRRFFLRHKELSKNKKAEHHSKGRANVTEISLRAWYTKLKEYLVSNDCLYVLTNPKIIFNSDETAFFVNLLTGGYICKKGETCQSLDSSCCKDNFTVMLTPCADGSLAPSQVIFKLKRKQPRIEKNIPPSWLCSISENGWQDSKTFVEYLQFFISFLIGKGLLVKGSSEKKVILFVDGAACHLSLAASEVCEKNGVILYNLYPSATHVLQPCDVGLMAPLKIHWANEVHKYKHATQCKAISKEVFAQLAKQAVDKLGSSVITKSFEKCGIFPFNPDKLDYSKLIATYTHKPSVDRAQEIHFLAFQGTLPAHLLQQFESTYNEHKNWQGDAMQLGLFNTWASWKSKVYGIQSKQAEVVPALDVNNDPPPENCEIQILAADIEVLGEGIQESMLDVAFEEMQAMNAVHNEALYAELTSDEEPPPVLLDANNLECELLIQELEAMEPQDTEVDASPRSTPQASSVGSCNVPVQKDDRNADYNSQRVQLLPVVDKILSLPEVQPPKVRKRKKIVYAISSPEFRQNKLAKKSVPGEAEEDWSCLYCHKVYSKDAGCPKWITCDACKGYMHYKCVPAAHNKATDLKHKIRQKTFEFICTNCS